jgi:hypothetical protein
MPQLTLEKLHRLTPVRVDNMLPRDGFVPDWIKFIWRDSKEQKRITAEPGAIAEKF